MSPSALLHCINDRHQTSFVLVERFHSGEQGAFAIADKAGERFVLKCGPGDSGSLRKLEYAAVTTTHLRRGGYPAPRYLLTGLLLDRCYSIQEALPGAPMSVLTADLLPQLLDLNARQVGQAVLTPGEWPARVINTVLHGGDGYCVLDSLRTYSSATAELLHVLQFLVATCANDHYETRDIVHYDFNFANILVNDGQVSGVIDWGDTCSGDAGFDLATLLFYAYAQPDPELHKQLRQYALERSGPATLSVYLAHMIIRQVDWSIRHHPRPVAEHWLRMAEEVLQVMKGYL